MTRQRPSANIQSRSRSRSADIAGQGTATAIHHDPRLRHQLTVYDAVAGRITAKLSNKTTTTGAAAQDESQKPTDAEQPPRLRKATVHNPILAPEEALFRRPDAPERYAEHDVYMAHDRDLPHRDVLPDSDLLKAIHLYASHFYAALNGPDARSVRVGSRSVDEGSMDETALLAFGILLEEAGRKALGKRGDLVFTEGQEIAPRRAPPVDPEPIADGGRVRDGQPHTATSPRDDDVSELRPLNTVGFQAHGTSRHPSLAERQIKKVNRSLRW
ncbi:hypothetical protein SODALDRAFT_349351 [Sodiomyces alkalinus F11]|uniref:Uncharacterized protein n=1 Tax=Sodiomyces alkalinus (strain CBS 110278 / VKM F-3762 / F11) TaxID=1314773 RepID=A0A3N2Q3P2_SODAK|nr:hypothetical protein SODALDRAFT_349351 [Sodiomyces alkalinus F11]ROT41337.1 hypothetical protein SODALDRAFT_349351 [Sodiomyces alkalinus F11]